MEVRDAGQAVHRLNELELVGGQVWANVWMTDCIARIEPSTGAVVGWIVLKGLRDGVPRCERGPREDVLNGVALDARNGRLYLTGKYWSRMFQVGVEPSDMGLQEARSVCFPKS